MPKFTNYTTDFNKLSNSWISKAQNHNYYRTTETGAAGMRAFGIIMLVIFIICCFL